MCIVLYSLSFSSLENLRPRAGLSFQQSRCRRRRRLPGGERPGGHGAQAPLRGRARDQDLEGAAHSAAQELPAGGLSGTGVQAEPGAAQEGVLAHHQPGGII